jgi:hypothetical protein
MTLFLAMMYSSTIFLRYALSDEQWIIRATNYWLRFDLRQGRPLFSWTIYATSLLHNSVGFDVVRVLRIGAIVGLAAAMSLLVVWMERFGIKRVHAVLIAAVFATLPSTQIYVVDATWLVMPTIATIVAMLLIHRALDATAKGWRRWSLLAVASVLNVASLAFYQPAVLIGFGMLSVPLLWVDVRDSVELKRRTRFVVVTSALLVATILVYYVVWLVLWWKIESHAMFYFGPRAYNSDALGRLKYFLTTRLTQVFNLWHVQSVAPSGFFYGSLALITGAAIADLVRAVGDGRLIDGLVRWGIKYVGTLALLMAGDSILLVFVIPIRSFVTMPALYLIATVLLAASIHRWLGVIRTHDDQLLSGLLGSAAVAGSFIAQYTVLTYFAVPLFVENQIVKRDVVEYFKTHPKLTYVHVLGRRDVIMNSGYEEYGWTNSIVDVYIKDMVKNVLDDVGVPSDTEVTASGVGAAQSGVVLPNQVPADALIIDLSRIQLR